MAQIRIPVQKLPPPDKNGDHAFQFRIISVDKNQWSAWSQLYIVKSIGQYRPLESENVTVTVGSKDLTVTWDTPTYYNYDGSSNAVEVDPISASVMINSASVIQHNHTQNFKQHDTDIFIQWDDGNFEYHDRVGTDTTSIIIKEGATSVRIIGLVALKDIPQKNNFEENESYQIRLDNYLGISGSVQGVYDLFKIFDTEEVALFG